MSGSDDRQVRLDSLDLNAFNSKLADLTSKGIDYSGEGWLNTIKCAMRNVEVDWTCVYFTRFGN